MTAAVPQVSVIVPTHNRPDRLERCLAALAVQAFHGGCEAIVVDDGSDVPLDPLIARLRARLPLTLHRQANAGPAAARNAGAAAASGELLAFTDDDCEPAADWVAALWSAHQQAPEALLGGHTVNALVHNACAEASQLLVDYLYEYYSGARASPSGGVRPRMRQFFTSNNLAVPAAVFRQLGGFDVTFPLAAGEDRELCDRWQDAGYPLVHVPGAVVRHAHALSPWRFWRQHVNYGRGAWHFRKARLRRQSGEIRVEPLAFYANLVAYPVRARGIRRGVPIAGLLGLAQAANAFGYWRERGWRDRSGGSGRSES